MDVMSIIAGLSTATKAAKDLRDIHELATSAEAKLKLAEIMGALADAKIGLQDSKEEIASLKKAIATKESDASYVSKLVQRGALLFDVETKSFKCRFCAEKEGKAYSLFPDRYPTPFQLTCQNCSGSYQNPDWNDGGGAVRQDYDPMNWKVI